MLCVFQNGTGLEEREGKFADRPIGAPLLWCVFRAVNSVFLSYLPSVNEWGMPGAVPLPARGPRAAAAAAAASKPRSASKVNPAMLAVMGKARKQTMALAAITSADLAAASAQAPEPSPAAPEPASAADAEDEPAEDEA